MPNFDWNAYNLGVDGPAGKRTNRSCPACGEETFVAVRSLNLQDGSVWRERQCRNCGHIEQRVQPPEKRLPAIDLDGEITVTQD